VLEHYKTFKRFKKPEKHMSKQIVIKVPDWVDEATFEEASKILLLYEINRNKSPKGLIDMIEKFEAKLSQKDIEEFLAERR
jgi:tagatose-1,6-bisphosphate aldolase